MIRDICKDEFFLSQKAESATVDDLAIAQDLLDTLAAHKDGCVGMAANMIGVSKRIIAFDNGGEYMVMFNPVIVKKSALYDAEEGVPVTDRHAENEAFSNYQSPVAERAVPDAHTDVHWLDGADHSARN